MAVVIRTPLDAAHDRRGRQAVWSVTTPFQCRRCVPWDDAFADARPAGSAPGCWGFAATAILLAMTGLYGTMALRPRTHARPPAHGARRDTQQATALLRSG
jgi:hypothetical protein